MEIKYHCRVNILNKKELTEAVRNCLLGYNFYFVDVMIASGEFDKFLLTAADKIKLDTNKIMTIRLNRDGVIEFCHNCISRNDLNDIISYRI